MKRAATAHRLGFAVKVLGDGGLPSHGTTPKIHYSSPRLDVEERRVRAGRRVERRLVLPQLRAHADLIDPIGFEQFLLDAPDGRDFDVMLEAKAKDLALLRLREQLADRGIATDKGRLQVPGPPG